MVTNVNSYKNQRISMMAQRLFILLAVLCVSVTSAESGAEQKDDLAAYGKALAEHNRVLGTWALYEGADAVFKQTLVPNEKRTGIVVQESNQTNQYKIGSISKTFTAVMAFKLIEAGDLSLDTPLADFYPGIPNAAEISIGQMLNHHSGIASYTDAKDFMAYYQKPQGQQHMIDRISKLKPAFIAGEKGAYSNSNYLLLGYILEQVSGQSYADLLKTHITEPLQLKHTFYGTDSNSTNLKSYQWNHDEDASKWEVIPPWSMTVAGSAGAIISTTDDLHSFFRGLFNDKLISAKSREQMTELNDGFGYGIFETSFNDNDKKIKGYWHNGRIEGFASHAIYFPDIDVTTVVLSNGLYKNSIDDLNQALTNAYKGNSLKNNIAALDVKADQLKPYIGYYQSDTNPLDIDITLIENQLLAQATGQGAFPLTPDGEHRFTFASAGIEVLFNQDFSGFTLNQGDNKNIYQRNDAAKAKAVKIDETILQTYTGVYASDNFPLDITVSLKDGQLFAQATGQGPIPLAAQSETEFTFSTAGISMVFDAENQSMAFTQMGRTFEMQKK